MKPPNEIWIFAKGGDRHYYGTPYGDTKYVVAGPVEAEIAELRESLAFWKKECSLQMAATDHAEAEIERLKARLSPAEEVCKKHRHKFSGLPDWQWGRWPREMWEMWSAIKKAGGDHV